MGSKWKILAAFALAGWLLGCADTHQLVREGATGTKLTNTDSLYIAVCRDGAYGTAVYAGSGAMTSQTLVSAFSKHAQNVEMSHGYESFDDALVTARAKKVKYLIYPTILPWEDRATEWSGIPDRVEVKVEIVDVQTGKAVESAVISGKSGLATLGGDHPQDLLPKPVEEFVSSLY
ncbi:MAG TPA: DUF4823 domain-containing protein [Burkholderiales bacterium]|nr:DUF4823 domain-containing protein [Burkholderiales bacterium]